MEQIYDYADQYANKNDVNGAFRSEQIKNNMRLEAPLTKAKWTAIRERLTTMIGIFREEHDNHMIIALNDLLRISSDYPETEEEKENLLRIWKPIEYAQALPVEKLTKAWTEYKNWMPDQKYFIFDDNSQTVYITNEFFINPPENLLQDTSGNLLQRFIITCGLLNRFRLSGTGQYPMSMLSIPFNIGFWMSPARILKKDLHVLYSSETPSFVFSTLSHLSN